MNITEARQVLEENTASDSRWSENSFLGQLHEYAIFDTTAFSQVTEALEAIGPTARTSLEFSQAYRIFDYSMLMFTCHFDPMDGFQFEDDSETVYERRDLVRETFRKWFSREV